MTARRDPSRLLFRLPYGSLVVPHEQLWVFLEDAFWNFLGDGDDGSVVAGLPGAAEAGADGF